MASIMTISPKEHAVREFLQAQFNRGFAKLSQDQIKKSSPSTIEEIAKVLDAFPGEQHLLLLGLAYLSATLAQGMEAKFPGNSQLNFYLRNLLAAALDAVGTSMSDILISLQGKNAVELINELSKINTDEPKRAFTERLERELPTADPTKGLYAELVIWNGVWHRKDCGCPMLEAEKQRWEREHAPRQGGPGRAPAPSVPFPLVDTSLEKIQLMSGITECGMCASRPTVRIAPPSTAPAAPTAKKVLELLATPQWSRMLPHWSAFVGTIRGTPTGTDDDQLDRLLASDDGELILQVLEANLQNGVVTAHTVRVVLSFFGGRTTWKSMGHEVLRVGVDRTRRNLQAYWKILLLGLAGFVLFLLLIGGIFLAGASVRIRDFVVALGTGENLAVAVILPVVLLSLVLMAIGLWRQEKATADNPHPPFNREQKAAFPLFLVSVPVLVLVRQGVPVDWILTSVGCAAIAAVLLWQAGAFEEIKRAQIRTATALSIAAGVAVVIGFAVRYLFPLLRKTFKVTPTDTHPVVLTMNLWWLPPGLPLWGFILTIVLGLVALYLFTQVWKQGSQGPKAAGRFAAIVVFAAAFGILVWTAVIALTTRPPIRVPHPTAHTAASETKESQTEAETPAESSSPSSSQTPASTETSSRSSSQTSPRPSTAGSQESVVNLGDSRTCEEKYPQRTRCLRATQAYNQCLRGQEPCQYDEALARNLCLQELEDCK